MKVNIKKKYQIAYISKKERKFLICLSNGWIEEFSLNFVFHTLKRLMVPSDKFCFKRSKAKRLISRVEVGGDYNKKKKKKKKKGTSPIISKLFKVNAYISYYLGKCRLHPIKMTQNAFEFCFSFGEEEKIKVIYFAFILFSLSPTWPVLSNWSVSTNKTYKRFGQCWWTLQTTWIGAKAFAVRHHLTKILFTSLLGIHYRQQFRTPYKPVGQFLCSAILPPKYLLITLHPDLAILEWGV